MNVGCGELKQKALGEMRSNETFSILSNKYNFGKFSIRRFLPTFDAFTLGIIDVMVNGYWFIDLK